MYGHSVHPSLVPAAMVHSRSPSMASAVGAGSSGIIGNGETFYTAPNAYDPLTNTWTAKAATVGREQCGGLQHGGLWVHGYGKAELDHDQRPRRYDPVADAWSYVGVIGGLASGARSTGIAFAIGNTAYIGGGLMSSVAASSNKRPGMRCIHWDFHRETHDRWQPS